MERQANESAGSGTVRAINQALVLDAIRRHGPTSRAQLSRSLSLAKPTVSEIIERLIADGLVVESESRPRSRSAAGPVRGRPPRLLAYNERSEYVLAIHVGVRTTTVALADATGREVARRRIANPVLPAELALGEIGAVAREVVVKAGIPRRRLSAVGVCIPGQVDVVTGTCVHAPNLGWRNVPVVGVLGAALGVPIHVSNSVQAAATAEQLEGAGRGAVRMAMVYAGTGVGAAIVDETGVYRGTRGMGGELGHAVMPGLDGACACGRHGCVETAASAPAVARAARDAVSAGSPTRMTPLGNEITSLDVYAAAESGDTLAQALLGEAGRTLGIAASWVVNLVNPDVLVLGGGLIGAGPHILDPFRSALEAHAIPAALVDLQVRTATLGSDARIRGAVILALGATSGLRGEVRAGRQASPV